MVKVLVAQEHCSEFISEDVDRSSTEQRFMEASKAYVAGKPFLSDDQFDDLKKQLRDKRSIVVAQVPEMSLKCPVTLALLAVLTYPHQLLACIAPVKQHAYALVLLVSASTLSACGCSHPVGICKHSVCMWFALILLVSASTLSASGRSSIVRPSIIPSLGVYLAADPVIVRLTILYVSPSCLNLLDHWQPIIPLSTSRAP